MDYPLQPLSIPGGCRITKNDFTTYNPVTEYTEDKNLFNLTEDLLQLEFEHSNIIVDLGWYGDTSSNVGEFKIYVIENTDWEKPIRTEVSKNQKIITEKLESILNEFHKNGEIKPVPNKSYK